MKPKNYSGLPTVTEILEPWSGLDHIPPDRLEYAGYRGSLTHSHCAAIAKDMWVPDPTPELKGYVQSFRAWFDLYVDEVLLVEEELVDEDLGYCGHPDLIVRSAKLGGVILPDLKTPLAVKKTWEAQLAAYEKLANKNAHRWGGYQVDRAGSLRLSPEGKSAKFDEFTRNGPHAFAAFYGALLAHKFFKGG